MARPVLDRRVGTGIDQCLVAVDAPAHEPRWRTAITACGDDLTSPLSGTDVTAPDDDLVADSCLHGNHLLDVLEVRRFPPPLYPC